LDDGLALLAGTDLRGGLAALALPCCLVHGAQDALMPAAASRWLAGTLPQARLHVLADCGHAVFLSQPAACAALIRSFLDD
jgi:pimeloyl-[acyl-carrier protein] methyl ester esterase